MSNLINAIHVPTEDEASDARVASNLRDLADRVEQGQIKSVVTLTLSHDQDIDLIIRCKSRLEFMGALQYANDEIGRMD